MDFLKAVHSIGPSLVVHEKLFCWTPKVGSMVSSTRECFVPFVILMCCVYIYDDYLVHYGTPALPCIYEALFVYEMCMNCSFDPKVPDSMSPSLSPSSAIAHTPNTTEVPSCMDLVAGGAPGYLGSRGVAMYRTKFSSAGTVPMRLQFQACSFYCRVWVNGNEIGDHRAGGYVAFWLDIPTAMLKASGENELFVLADNRFNKTTAPMHTGFVCWILG